MADNARIVMLGRAMYERMSDTDLVMLCSYLQAADYRYANLSGANLPHSKIAAVTQIVEYSRKQDLLAVLNQVLGQYYPAVLDKLPTSYKAADSAWGGFKASAYNPQREAGLPDAVMQSAEMQARLRRWSCFGWIFSLLLVLGFMAGIGYFVISEGGFNLSFIGQPVGRMDSLNAIQMVSPTDGWIAGETYNEGQRSNVLLLHYVGDKWEKLTGLGQGQLNAISMVSADEGWAVGATMDGETTGALLLHYNKGQWQRLEPNIGTTILKTVYMIGPDEGWAAGQSFGLSPTLLHYHDGTWQAVSLSDVSVILGLNSIYMLNANRGWAVGGNGSILEYRDGKWQQAVSPTQRTLNSVYMLSADEGWAVGDQGVMVYYRNGEWTRLDSPSTYDLTSVRFSDGVGWVGGDESLLLRYQSGMWTVGSGQIGSSFDMTGLSLIGADEGWASGRYGNVLRLKEGKWSRFYSN